VTEGERLIVDDAAPPDPADPERPSIASDALLRPVRAGNAFEDTVGRLLQTIRLGVVAPGEALPPERDLAARFAVSRDTVREALRSLADAGFVVSRRGRYGGTFVSDVLPPAGAGTALDSAEPPRAVSAAELDDVLGLRELLETGAARSAAARSLAAADRESLWASLRDCRGAPATDYRRLDSRLHLAIGELAGIPSLVPLLADSRTRVNEFLDRIPLLEPNIAHSDQQHEAIVLAILTGDGDGAAEAVREHLAGTAALLRGFLG
jgi:GntR family transcriptional repressor for pyruvate dehydrogenase complex